MKNLNRWACLLLSAVLIFGGCTAAPASDKSDVPPKASSAPADSISPTPKGRYVETEITPPPQSPDAMMVAPLGVFPHADGSVDYFVEERTPNGESPADGQTDSFFHYRSPDGGATWMLQETPWLAKVAALCGVSERLTDPPKPGMLTSRAIVRLMDMDSAGNLYCVLHDSDDKLRLIKVTPDGSVSEIPIVDWQNTDADSGLTPRAFRVTESGNMGVSYLPRSAGTALYDGKTGESLIDVYDEVGGSAFAFTDRQVMLLTASGKLSYYETDTSAKTFDSPQQSEGMALETDATGNVYLASHQGVISLGHGQSVFETVMTGSLYLFSDPNCKIEELRYQPDTNDFYMILYSKGGERKLYRYTFDPEIPIKADTQLDVFSLNDSGTVRRAILDFQMKNPTAIVNYQVGLTEDSPMTETDVIKALEAELQAGKGPDVLILDGLDARRYAASGWLADLDGLAGTKERFAAIASPCGENAVPTRFIASMIVKEDASALPESLELPGFWTLVGNFDALWGEETTLTLAAEPFAPTVMASINSKSGKTELASAFVESMLSDTVQTEDYEDGFPVRISSFDKQLALEMARYERPALRKIAEVIKAGAILTN